MRSNRVTRQVSFNRSKIGGKCQNSNVTFWVCAKIWILYYAVSKSIQKLFLEPLFGESKRSLAAKRKFSRGLTTCKNWQDRRIEDLEVGHTVCQKSYFRQKIEFWRNLANHLIWILAPIFNIILEFYIRKCTKYYNF